MKPIYLSTKRLIIIQNRKSDRILKEHPFLKGTGEVNRRVGVYIHRLICRYGRLALKTDTIEIEADSSAPYIKISRSGFIK